MAKRQDPNQVVLFQTFGQRWSDSVPATEYVRLHNAEGANTFIGSYVVTALKATSAMAALMVDKNVAEKCSKQAQVCLAKYEEICWNEESGYDIQCRCQRNQL
jgi:hypothetical protein